MDVPPPPGFAVDESPPPGFTVDPPIGAALPTDRTADQTTPQSPDLPGFSDEQKRAILDYIPKAKDAADLEQFSADLTQGHSKIGNAQQILDLYGKGHRQFSWAAPTAAAVTPAQPHTPLEKIRAAAGDGLLTAIDQITPGLGSFLREHRDAGKAFTEHVANAFAADYGPEFAGLLQTLADPKGYEQFGSNLDRHVAHERARLQGDSEGHPIASLAGELTGMGLAAPLGGEVVDAIPDVEAAAEAAPRFTSAVKAGVGSAAYGSGAAGPGNRAEGAAVGGALGSATDAVIPIIAARFAARAAAKEAGGQFGQAAERQGIDYMAADVPGATKSRFATALSALTLGGIPLADRGAKNAAIAAAAASRVASDIGSVGDRTAAGQAAQRGAKSFIASSADTLNNLESKIPINSAAAANVTSTRTALSSLAQSFSSNPKLAAAFRDPKVAAYLEALTPQTTKEATGLLDSSGQPIMRDVTHGGGLSWQDLRDFRSRVGQIIGQPGLTSDGAQLGQLRALYGALSDDIRQTAQGYGPQAANAWGRWNNYARARANRIENVVSLITGNDNNKAPQSAFEWLQRLANEKGGDPPKLARALRSMPDDEAASVRATILDDLGHMSAGTKGGDETFSPAQFVTSWNNLSDRAKNVLFTGEHRNAINDLVNVFSGMKASAKFANTSKTGIAVAAAHTAPVLYANPVLGVLYIALQYGGGKLLASPAFARRVAATPKNLAGARAFWSRPWVRDMAVKNPAIAAEIQAFQRAVLNSANDNTASAAAAQPQQQDQQQ